MLANLLDAQAVFVFGSVAAGRSRPDSDVDLAFLTKSPVEPVALFQARCRLADLLGRPVDIVSLRDASPIIAMQVLRKGRVVVDRDPRARALFTMAAPSRYEDLRIVRAPAEAAIRRRAAHAGR
jgi:predicted nucleotidyltransferase